MTQIRSNIGGISGLKRGENGSAVLFDMVERIDKDVILQRQQ